MRYFPWLIIAIGLLTSQLLYSQSAWQNTLKTELEQLDKVGPENWPAHVSALEKLAKQYPDEWLLQYYAGWSATQLSFRSGKAEAENLCNKAEPYVKKALDMQPDNTETLTLMAYWLSAKINAVPSRGAKLGVESRKYAEKGINANPDNPRAWLIKALNIYYTPKIFGGGKQRAKSTVDIAGNKFAAFRPNNTLAPNWGQQIYNVLSESYK
ncbi:hypothetical protein DVR12_18860 [Chitinophaga silvatica]|uniref:Tetratricopeptide repeat protein n=1 Tax=Chitinophaga silvatica TaxID=2282649 RepID=A0A3E1Y6Q4_9BACT|nr:hypothetical protein [Chitinophaga silvatica]RFS20624.1 hypothetical protein DVR12_18860 [Chitinophaga silvatica]